MAEYIVNINEEEVGEFDFIAITTLKEIGIPVVRCRECKWYKHDSDCYGYCTREGYDERWYTVYTTDFCSMAERKDNETES